MPIANEQFRLVECFHTPSSTFSIYDYTKVAYLTGEYICIREVSSTLPCEPQFIALDHKFLKVHGILSMPNCLMLIDESSSHDLNIRFYDNTPTPTTLKLSSELLHRYSIPTEPCHPIVHIQHNPKTIYLIITHNIDCEIIVINYHTRIMIARGYLCREVIDVGMKYMENEESLSVVCGGYGIVELELCLMKEDMIVLGKKNVWEFKGKKILHCWVGEKLIIWNCAKLEIWLHQKELQTLDSTEEVYMLNTSQHGFISTTYNELTFYRENNNYYEINNILELEQRTIMQGLQLSPQQDLMAYYDVERMCIGYYNLRDVGERRNRVVVMEIKHRKRERIMICGGLQAMFVIVEEAEISVYSPYTYECYLKSELSAFEKNDAAPKLQNLMKSIIQMSTMGPTPPPIKEHIEVVALHPMLPIFAVAFKNLIKIYHILYNELKTLREIQLSHCRAIGFNNAGTIMHAVIGGKQGAKIYLYTMNEPYSVEILVVSRRVEMVNWSHHDTHIYCLHDRGYYSWSTASQFKLKSDGVMLEFVPKGIVVNDKNNTIVVWGGYDIVEIVEDQIVVKGKSDKEILQVIWQKGRYVFNVEKYGLGLSMNIDVNQCMANNNGFKCSRERVSITPIKDNILLCQSQDKEIFCLEWGGEEKSRFEVVMVERKKMQYFLLKYKEYEMGIEKLKEQLENTVMFLKEDFKKKEEEIGTQFRKELKDQTDRYQYIRAEKDKIELTMEENIAMHEKETMGQIKDLEKIYERKIALTTNKLLTSEEINYRNKLIAESNLKMLEERHGENIVTIRKEYAEAICNNMFDKDGYRQQLYTMKMEYETKLSELEQENEALMRQFQLATENNLTSLKKNVLGLEVKYSEVVSQKYNLEKELQEETVVIDSLNKQNEALEEKYKEEERRCQSLTKDYQKIESLLVDKDKLIESQARRLQDLEKANEIFKYRIVEMKSQHDPKEEEISSLKQSMIELENEYEMVVNKAHENEENLTIFKKETVKLREQKALLQKKEKKMRKTYQTIIDKIREITKSPIQDIRKQLIRLLEAFDLEEGNGVKDEPRSNSPLGELNRMREHLEVCLEEAIDCGKKTEIHKNNQICKKNRENSELLKEINDLRRRIRTLELENKEKDRIIFGVSRSELPQTAEKEERQETENESMNREPTRYNIHTISNKQTTNANNPNTNNLINLNSNKTRESFFQRSLFKQPWNEKRFKTGHGSRKKSASNSYTRDRSNNLLIESRGEDIEEFKRIIEQKEAIIKQLINKIQRLS